MLGLIWNTVIKEPIHVVLIWLVQLTGNLGVAVIVLTIIIQLVLLPLRLPSLKSAQKIRSIKPQLDELKKKHKGDNRALAQAQMDLYKVHNINVLGGILPTLLSIPIILALYQVLLSTLGELNGGSVMFFWMDVTKSDPYYILPIFVGIAQYVLSAKMFAANAPVKTEDKDSAKSTEKTQNPEEMAQMIQTQMKYIFPVMSAFITATLPAGVGLYWFTSAVFAIIQQQVVNNKYDGSQNNSTSTK